MEAMILKRYKRIRLTNIKKNWLSTREKQSDDLLFIKEWVDGLTATLRQYSYDEEFVLEILGSAYQFILDELSNEAKADAFTYLLGKTVKR
jgi:hypothetical protein